MNVLSLCDGMSCGQISLVELGIKYEKYYASEIDRNAIRQTQLNFPETIQLGDIESWREWNIDWGSVGLILAGTPCTGFSFAGKGLAFDDPQSKLFFVFADILKHVGKYNPDVLFLLENVRMKKEYIRIISDFVGLFPVAIDSALVSAQVRKRLYWTNIRTKKTGLFGDVYTDIPQPEDRGIILSDIIESEVDKKYFISEEQIKRIFNYSKGSNFKNANEKSLCLTTKQGSLTNDANYITKNPFISVNRKSPAQRSSTGRSLSKKHNYQIIQLNDSIESNGVQPYQQNRVYDDRGKCPSLMAQMSSYAIRQLGRGRNNGGTHLDKSPSITSSSWEWNNFLSHGDVRRLTPTECARLQTVPEWYKWKCSVTQQYRMLGNGWTIEVIKHILSYLY